MEKSIVLYGYMASGKSAVGQILAAKLAIPHVDLDLFIEERFNRTITQIFEEKGELFFRKIEHEVLQEVIKNNQVIVLSVGGGTPCYYNNHLLLKNAGFLTFFLKTSPQILSDRIVATSSSRPLLSRVASDDLTEYIAKHLFDRNYFYRLAQQMVETDYKSPQEVADEIILLLKGME